MSVRAGRTRAALDGGCPDDEDDDDDDDELDDDDDDDDDDDGVAEGPWSWSA